MTKLEPQNPCFESKIRASFARHGLMANIGARIASVTAGEVEIELDYRRDLTQQHGYIHGAVIAAIVDTACGYAALTLLPPNFEIVTVEYKINFLAPAAAEKIRARGRAIKAGKSLSVCSGEVFAIKDGKEKLVATMQATMMAVAEE